MQSAISSASWRDGSSVLGWTVSGSGKLQPLQSSSQMLQDDHDIALSIPASDDDDVDVEMESDGLSMSMSIANFPSPTTAIHQISPVYLVNRETKWLGYLRLTILVLLLVGGCCGGYAAYQWNSSNNKGIDDSEYSLFIMESCTNQTVVFPIANGTIGSNDNNTGLEGVPDDVKEQAIVISFSRAPETTADKAPCDWQLYLLQSDGGDDGEERKDTNNNKNSKAKKMTGSVSAYFALLLILFWIYDWLVERRQSVVVNIATKSSAIVENLFPAQIRDRMMQNMPEKQNPEAYQGVTAAAMNTLERRLSILTGNATSGGGGGSGSAAAPAPASASPTVDSNHITPKGTPPITTTTPPKEASNELMHRVSVKQFLSHQENNLMDLSTQPIADLFPNTTVLFADITGFTAWSSEREPSRVFTLLENLYRSFDAIASKLKVFKVETIGDCYVAVSGLPNPDTQHALCMARFAYQCMVGMKNLLGDLEGILGPGTSDLGLRVGLHSGAVTAGVLRGEKARFQLFGDTVNTASRMESTGERGRIQVSQETGDLIMAAGKAHWLKPREERVVAKGKGELQTYWLDPTKRRRRNKTHKERIPLHHSNNRHNQNNQLKKSGAVDTDATFDDKYARLIDWNVDVLLHHLARVISSRSRLTCRGALVDHSNEAASLPLGATANVAEIVVLPPFDDDTSQLRRTKPDISMLQQIRTDLHEYVTRIALMYRDVPFHNFEHASHVTLSANKLLNRLIESDEYDTEFELHSSTFGISSDPLTHFSIVFAALIHDVDHLGLPNTKLVKDCHPLATKFQNKSVAEQNSVHLGWETLMDPRFERLRECIYRTNIERKRFRQLVINCVMATDIADRTVLEGRQDRWDRAFRGHKLRENATESQVQADMNRKATAVIEHIIQVSDVAHTMQHWHIYRRWNERLFHEMHDAFRTARAEVDPATNWYDGEIGFFDFYLIPLAMKLKECGVFRAAGSEYISYVLKNKKEWESKGRQVVAEMVHLRKDAEDNDGSATYDYDYDSDGLEYDSPGDMASDIASE